MVHLGVIITFFSQVNQELKIKTTMGNKNSCCPYSSPTTGGKEDERIEEYLPEGEESIGNLQHISEREPEDWDADPSLHPKAGTIFMERSKVSLESKIICSIHLIINICAIE